jgi:hypothetical protein
MGRNQFLNFLGAPMILKRKSVFLAVNASLRFLNNVSGVYLKTSRVPYLGLKLTMPVIKSQIHLMKTVPLIYAKSVGSD